MNYKVLSGIFASLLAISLAANVYQDYLRQSPPIKIRRAYEKKILESEVKDIKNIEDLRRLQERIEDLERKSSSNYFPWSNEYDSRRVL